MVNIPCYLPAVWIEPVASRWFHLDIEALFNQMPNNEDEDNSPNISSDKNYQVFCYE